MGMEGRGGDGGGEGRGVGTGMVCVAFPLKCRRPSLPPPTNTNYQPHYPIQARAHAVLFHPSIQDGRLAMEGEVGFGWVRGGGVGKGRRREGARKGWQSLFSPFS